MLGTDLHLSTGTPGRTARSLSAFLVTAGLLHSTAAAAQELHGSVTLYAWVPWIDGTVTSRSSGASVETSISGGDVVDALDFAFMAAGDVHYGRFGLLHDTLYSKLGNDGRLSGPLSSTVDVETELLISTTALGYQVYRENGRLLEPFVGVRYVSLETDVTLTGGGPIGVTVNADVDVDWWDPVIGLRGRLPLTGKLTAGGIVDIGGFGVGSEFAWQIFAGLDYAFTEKLSANAGFRYLSIDYEGDRAEANLDTYGPLLGATLRF